MPSPAKPVPMITARVRMGAADVWVVDSAMLIAPLLLRSASSPARLSISGTEGINGT
jgi:hypothetical protein